MGTRWTRRVVVAGLVILAGAGCNPISMWSLIMYGSKGSEVMPEYLLPAHGDNKTVKIVVLASTPNNVNGDFAGCERMFATMLHKELKHWYEIAEWQVELVKPTEVEEYVRSQPASVSAAKVGRHFDADYVIDVELTRLSMFEPGSLELFKGHADVSVVVHDVVEGGEPIHSFEYTAQFPRVGPVMRGFDTSASQFRQNFLKDMSVELSWKFAPHLREDETIHTSGRLR